MVVSCQEAVPAGTSLFRGEEMEIASLDELGPIDKPMIVRDDTDSWPWRDDAFKVDSESTLAITTSFWDDLTQNDSDSQSIFASTPPIIDTRESSPSYFSLDSQAESENLSSESYAVENGGRFKRRRMLHFSNNKEDCVATDSPTFETVSTIDSTTFVSCVNPLIAGGEDFLMPTPSDANTFWYNKDEEASKGSDDKWMSKCLDHKDPHSPPAEKAVVSNVPPAPEASGKKSLPAWKSSGGEVLQGPLTPFSKGSTPGWRPSPLMRFKGKASSPVVYPFALLKPSGAQGELTLNDINRSIMIPSPRPPHRQASGDDERSGAHSGAGLSGKSVVACTKIHTEGNGTITIMRTRG